jgi:Skp family chaperone for outer membrane proteins
MCVFCPMFMYGQKTAYLYSDSVLLAVPEYGKNVLKLDSMKQSFGKEVESKQALIQQQYEKLVKPYAPKDSETLLMLKKRMSVVDTLSLGTLLDENVQLQKKKTSYDRILQATYMQNVQPILSRVNTVISNYAMKNGLSAVYSMEQLKQTLVYIDPKQNITGVVIELLKKK